MKPNHIVFWLMLLWMLPAQAQTDDGRGMTIDVVHFWVSKSESSALDVYRRAWKKTGNTWIDLPEANKVAVQRTVSERIVNGYAPSAMQWNANQGAEELPKMGIVLSMDELAKKEHWEQVLPRTVFDRISYQGNVYFAPTNIHAENWLWMNRPLFQSLGLSTPQSWDDVFEAAQALQDRGILPIALGGGAWEISVLFNNILFDQMGADAYTRIIHGDAQATMLPQMLEALKMLRRVASYTEHGEVRQKKTWADASAAVGRGEAGMQFMGDWAKGELTQLGYQAGKDFDCTLVPGTKMAYFLVVDAFAFPLTNRSGVGKAQQAFASMLMEPANQVAFSRIKGAIPARLDVDPEGLDVCGKIGLSMLRQNRAMSAQSMAMTAQTAEAWVGALADFFDHPDITEEEAQQRLYHVLQQSALEF